MLRNVDLLSSFYLAFSMIDHIRHDTFRTFFARSQSNEYHIDVEKNARRGKSHSNERNNDENYETNIQLNKGTMNIRSLISDTFIQETTAGLLQLSASATGRVEARALTENRKLLEGSSDMAVLMLLFVCPITMNSDMCASDIRNSTSKEEGKRQLEKKAWQIFAWSKEGPKLSVWLQSACQVLPSSLAGFFRFSVKRATDQHILVSSSTLDRTHKFVMNLMTAHSFSSEINADSFP